MTRATDARQLSAPVGRPTHMRLLPLAAVAMLALGTVVGCTAEPTPDNQATTVDSTTTTSDASESPTGQPETAADTPAPTIDPSTAEKAVLDPASALLQAHVKRVGDGFEVTAWWRRLSRGDGIVTLDATGEATYEKWRLKKLSEWFPIPPPGQQPDVEALSDTLLQSSVPSSRADLWVVTAGGDGATILPFEVLARSSDEGETWETFTAPMFDGARGYQSGSVVLADGRIAVLLDTFSDETFTSPAARHHGLWISDGENWESFTPFEPSFTPRLSNGKLGRSPITSVGASSDGGGVVWATTKRRLYVSTDGAATFTAIPARPRS